jgi:hypothetical protein
MSFGFSLCTEEATVKRPWVWREQVHPTARPQPRIRGRGQVPGLTGTGAPASVSVSGAVPMLRDAVAESASFEVAETSSS